MASRNILDFERYIARLIAIMSPSVPADADEETRILEDLRRRVLALRVLEGSYCAASNTRPEGMTPPRSEEVGEDA